MPYYDFSPQNNLSKISSNTVVNTGLLPIRFEYEFFIF